MRDPTYDAKEIDANHEWKLAWMIAQIIDDNAPIGWSKHCPLAKGLLANYDIKPKEK